MSVIRNELRTGFLVAFAAVMLAGILIYLEAPGLSGERRIYRVYFDNAGGINGGAPVMLAGRRIGQVSRILSPVPEAERPKPDLAVIVEVAVDPKARIYKDEHVLMVQYSLLGEEVIDFTQGKEASGLATTDTRFIGSRQPGLSDVGQQVLEKLDPVVGSATLAMKDLQKTAERLSAITQDGSDLIVALASFRNFGDRLLVLTGTDGALQGALDNIEDLTSKDGPLAKTFTNAEKFTGTLAENKDVNVALRNFRKASENFNSGAVALKGGVKGIKPTLNQTVRNAEQFTDTIKRQPWRLIWPSTKKYPEDENCPPMIGSRGKR
jgi:ABC-type transporter Mla subunit MlaD